MNKTIKHINDAFDFDSVDNQKDHINIYKELPVIKECLDNFKELKDYQYHILTTTHGFYKVENVSLLKKLIPYFIGQFGNDCNLNWIDTSNITDMYALFMSTDFNGDISEWDVSNVTIMSLLFANSKFNGDISKWDVSKVSDMSSMFNMSKFNKDISKWNVSNVVNMRRMFYNAEFNGDISRWDVKNVITMECMFAYSKFTGDISGWRPSIEENVNMHNMFLSCYMKKIPIWYTEDRPIMEAFDFNSVTNKKPSITDNIKRITEETVKNEILPLFNNLRPDYIEKCKFIPEYRFVNNKCELLYKDKVIIDFTFGLNYIDEMNIYDTCRCEMVDNGYVQDVSVIFYIVRHMPLPVNNLNFRFKYYVTYKLQGSYNDELVELTRIMEDYTESLPEHITFNSKYMKLVNIRFENENAIKKFIYKLRKDNTEQKYVLKDCIFITETPPEFRFTFRQRSKGTTTKLVRKYINAPLNTLLEGFDFNTIAKCPKAVIITMEDRLQMFDEYLKTLYQNKTLQSMHYLNNHFDDIWRGPDITDQFNGKYYKGEVNGNCLDIICSVIRLIFHSTEEYSKFCNDIKIFREIRILGELDIIFHNGSKSNYMIRLENFGNLGETITYVNILYIQNLILHDFAGMPETKNFNANMCQIITFNNFNYKDYVNTIDMYYKPNQPGVYDWSGFPNKIAGIFNYGIHDDDEYYSYNICKQFTTLRGFPADFKFIRNPENNMESGCAHIIDKNMKKWQRDRVRQHIMDLLL